MFPALIEDQESNAEQLANKMNLLQDIEEDDIQTYIDEALAQYPDKVAAYRNGKKGLLGLFMGEVMKRSKGKADPKKQING